MCDLDASGERLVGLGQLGVVAVERLDLYLVLAHVRLVLLLQPRHLRLVLGLDVHDRPLQLVQRTLTALPALNNRYFLTIWPVFIPGIFRGEDGIPPPQKNTIPPSGCQIVCSKSLSFGLGNELQIDHGNILLMDKKHRKLFLTKQSEGCKFVPKSTKMRV